MSSKKEELRKLMREGKAAKGTSANEEKPPPSKLAKSVFRFCSFFSLRSTGFSASLFRSLFSFSDGLLEGLNVSSAMSSLSQKTYGPHMLKVRNILRFVVCGLSSSLSLAEILCCCC